MTVYGDLEQIMRMLRPTVATEFTTDVHARLDAIQLAVSSAIDDKLGRTFGAPVSDTTQLLYAGRSSVLLLAAPARAITSVAVDGTVDGIDMTGGTAIAADEYAYEPYDSVRGLIYGLRLLTGAWWGAVDFLNRPLVPVLVTGDFADTDDDAAVPEDIAYIANYLTAETFKAEATSAAGQIGLEGNYVPPRNPWNDPLVKAILHKHQSVREIAV